VLQNAFCEPNLAQTLAFSLSRDGVYIVEGKGTNLIPVPWICFSPDRLITYTKLAVLQGDPSVNQAQTRALQAAFLINATDLSMFY